jgi:hypothetical protein
MEGSIALNRTTIQKSSKRGSGFTSSQNIKRNVKLRSLNQRHFHCELLKKAWQSHYFLMSFP